MQRHNQTSRDKNYNALDKNSMDKICKLVEITIETFQSKIQREKRIKKTNRMSVNYETITSGPLFM